MATSTHKPQHDFREGDRVRFTRTHPAHPNNTLGVLNGGTETVTTDTEGQVYQAVDTDRILVLIRRDKLPYLWCWAYPDRIEHSPM